jgi:hypothetical protein
MLDTERWASEEFGGARHESSGFSRPGDSAFLPDPDTFYRIVKQPYRISVLWELRFLLEQ